MDGKAVLRNPGKPLKIPDDSEPTEAPELPENSWYTTDEISVKTKPDFATLKQQEAKARSAIVIGVSELPKDKQTQYTPKAPTLRRLMERFDEENTPQPYWTIASEFEGFAAEPLVDLDKSQTDDIPYLQDRVKYL